MNNKLKKILDDINQLLDLGVGQSFRLKRIKEDIQSRTPLWPDDIRYVEELSTSFLENKKLIAIKKEKIIVLSIFAMLGSFVVFLGVSGLENYMTAEKQNIPESKDTSIKSKDISSESKNILSESQKGSWPLVENESIQGDPSSDSKGAFSGNTEFSSASIIHSSSSTQR